MPVTTTRMLRHLMPLASLLFRLPYNQQIMGRKSRAFPLIEPRKIWPGDAENGDRLTKGHFRFVGKQIDMASSTWYPMEVGETWLARLHSFNWLDDLRASSAPQARTTARALTLRWIEDHRRLRPKSWEPVTLATRLTQWMVHFEFLSSTAEPGLQRALLRSAMQQYHYLNLVARGGIRPSGLIRVLKALIIVGLCLPGMAGTVTSALQRLEQTLQKQIQPDGSHIERCPATQMRLLLDLLDIRAALSLSGSNSLPWLNDALNKSAGFLRLLQHGDGRLGNFQAEPLLSSRLISEALERADAQLTPLKSASGAAGFHRVRAGRSLLIVDAGTSTYDDHLFGVHASALAFEFSIGQIRLITNCGNFDLEEDWKELQRTTAAHSTLVWNDRNSAELLPNGGLGRQPSQIMARTAETQTHHHLLFSHDGYEAIGGGIHYRTLYLRKDGLVLEGEDRLEGANQNPVLVRFHLNPQVRAEITQTRRSALLRLSARERGWRFDATGALLQISESVVADERGQPQRAQQLILAPAYQGLNPEDWAMRWKFYQEGTSL